MNERTKFVDDLQSAVLQLSEVKLRKHSIFTRFDLGPQGLYIRMGYRGWDRNALVPWIDLANVQSVRIAVEARIEGAKRYFEHIEDSYAKDRNQA